MTRHSQILSSEFIHQGQSTDGGRDQRQLLGDDDGPPGGVLDPGLLCVRISGSAKIFGMSRWSTVSLSSISSHLWPEHSRIDVCSG